MATAVCLRHVRYQDLGVLDQPLRDFGFDIAYVDVMDEPGRLQETVTAPLVVILGGPFDVEDAGNQALQSEIAMTRARLAQNRPTIGICLGSQIIATAMGGRIDRMPAAEIGWRAIRLTDEGLVSPLRHLRDLDLLHWHGCESSLPAGGTRLATTDACGNQAFRAGPNVLGLQFHPEVRPDEGMRTWVAGHLAMLAQAGLSGDDVMAQTVRSSAASRAGVARMMSEWLKQIVCV